MMAVACILPSGAGNANLVRASAASCCRVHCLRPIPYRILKLQEHHALTHRSHHAYPKDRKNLAQRRMDQLG
jgi:hypothetical protein